MQPLLWSEGLLQPYSGIKPFEIPSSPTFFKSEPFLYHITVLDLIPILSVGAEVVLNRGHKCELTLPYILPNFHVGVETHILYI